MVRHAPLHYVHSGEHWMHIPCGFAGAGNQPLVCWSANAIPASAAAAAITITITITRGRRVEAQHADLLAGLEGNHGLWR